MSGPVKLGRPRSRASRQGILEATFRLLVERGYAGLSIEAVAQEAGSAKTTIYRWWSSRAELAVDAFFEATVDELRLPESGSAKEDFRRQITDLGALLKGPRGLALAGMLGGARTDPALGAALRSRWLEPRRRWGFARMTRAEQAGELRPGVDVGAALACLYGPVYAPLLFGQPIPDEDALARILEVSLAGVFRG